MALAQRRGETDEEYENRKKRVKRQRQGIGEDMFARMGGGGVGGSREAPNAPTNFLATDDELEQITFTWTNSTLGYPRPTYDIYISGGALVVSGVTSPHTEAIAPGTADYIVRAVNSEGTADSNIDSGTSILDNTAPIYLMTEPLVYTPTNLYPNWELVNGSHINQDIPTGTLPDGHVLVFNTGNPCNATYNDNGNGAFSYLFNQVQDPVRLLLQQTIGFGIFEVGKIYRYQAMVRTVTFTPIGAELRAIHLASMIDMAIVDADNAMIGENEEYTLRWIDFEVTDSGLGRGNFRHGAGVWDVLTTAQETRDIAIYEITP